MTQRIAEVHRDTKETQIQVRINLDGTGQSELSTGIGFFDHMLDQIARHGLIDIKIAAKGDLHIDYHHTVEDVGIVLGKALREALGDKVGVRRFASGLFPLDEALVQYTSGNNNTYGLRSVDARISEGNLFSAPSTGKMRIDACGETMRAACSHCC